MLLLAQYTGFSQRLNLNLDLGYNIGSKYQTTFSQPYQFIYAAPFGTNDDYYKPVYDQVRLANIQGIKSTNRHNYNFGFSFQYDFKNYFQLSLETSYGQFYSEAYYGFQNLLINLNSESTDLQTKRDDPALLDNKITISTWKNAYKLKLNYLLPIKSIRKYYASASYTYQYVFTSRYSSVLKENKSNYITNDTDEDGNIINEVVENEYLNVAVFQDKIFDEFKNDQFNHLIGFGIGTQYYNSQLGIDFQFSLPNKNVYYKNYAQILMTYKFKILSLNLFK